MFDNGEALVPCLDVGLGTETATVRNARTGDVIRLTGVKRLSLVGNRLVVPLRVVLAKGREALVVVSNEEVAWVRPVPAPKLAPAPVE